MVAVELLFEAMLDFGDSPSSGMSKPVTSREVSQVLIMHIAFWLVFMPYLLNAVIFVLKLFESFIPPVVQE